MQDRQTVPDLTELGLSADRAFADMVDASLDCIKIIALDGTVGFMNENGLCAMDIGSFAAIAGKRWSDLWPSEAQELIEDAVDRALAGEAVRFEAFCPTAIGHPRWWDVSVSPVERDGAVVSLLSISRDITDRVLREQRSERRERQALRRMRDRAAAAGRASAEISAVELLARVGPEASGPEASGNGPARSGVAEVAPLFDRDSYAMAEAERLAALIRMEVLDTPPDPELDRLTALAARLLDMPTALISLVDRDRQWFLSRVGMEAAQTPREQSFCSIAIQTPERAFRVEDASRHPKTHDNPLVTASNGIRAYLGVPLVLDSGAALGTLCVLGPETRGFSDADEETLRTLAGAATAIIQKTAMGRELHRAEIVKRELKHRMGNIYAQISSIVGLLRASASDLDDFTKALRANITALSRTQARIARGRGWESINLCALAEEVVSGPEERIDCEVRDDVEITPNAAFLLTLALQELTTNSRKHGVLRGADSRVRLDLHVENETFALVWREGTALDAASGVAAGGGADEEAGERETRDVAVPHSGFGQRLLTRIVPTGLDGEASLEVLDGGLRYTLRAPRERVELPR